MKTLYKTTKVILIFLSIVLINNGSLYSQTTTFEVIKESMDAAQAYSVAESPDHGFVVSCIDGLGDDLLIFKLDSLGNGIWSKTISSYGARNGYHIINTVDSAFVIAGIVNYEIFLLKIDCTGEVLWEKIFEDSNNMFINSVIQNSDKEYLLVGRAENNSNSYRPLLIKTNENGEILWEKTYDIANYADGFSVAETFDGGYIIGGSATLSALLIKTDSDGNLTWFQTYESMFSTGSITPAFQTHDSCYVFITNSIAFDIDGNENTQCDFFKTDNSGNVIYRKGYYKKMQSILSACQTSDEGYLLTGTGNSAIYMFETD